MRNPTLSVLALLCLVLTATVASASELRLRWDSCYGDGGADVETFACGDAVGGAALVGSFVMTQTVTQIAGLDVIIDITSLGPTLPAWWDFTPEGCRQSALGVTFTRPPGSVACADRYHGAAVGGIAGYRTYWTSPGTGSPDRARLILALGVPAAFTAEAGHEIFAFQIPFEHAPWTGSPACAGCVMPVCIAWGQAWFQRSTGEPVRVAGADTPANGSNVTWQPGAVATTHGGCPPGHLCDSWVACEAATPTRTPTWGRIKALYR